MLRKGTSPPFSQSCTTPWKGAPNEPPYPARVISATDSTVSTQPAPLGQIPAGQPGEAEPGRAAPSETITTTEAATVQPAGSQASPKCR